MQSIENPYQPEAQLCSMVVLETNSELLLGCILTSTCSKKILERIMSDALEGHKANVSNGGRFADDTAFGDEEEEEGVNIVTSGDITCTR